GDDPFTTDFDPPYSSVIPALQAYVNGGGVLWVQSAIQGSAGNNFPMPFGGIETLDLESSDFIVDTSSPMMTGVSNPINGNFASHGSYSALPAGAHIVARVSDANGLPVLYELRPVS